MALRPERHTLLMVLAGTDIRLPPLTAAWRAVIWPWPARLTCPISTESTWSADTPAGESASAMANPPGSMGVKPPNAPESFPMGVRAPATMTASAMLHLRFPPVWLPVGNPILLGHYRRVT